MLPLANPADPLARTDFDADRPLRLTWHGRTVSVFRAPQSFEHDGTAMPQLMALMPKGGLRRIRPCLAWDTRATVERDARAWLERQAPPGPMGLPPMPPARTTGSASTAR